MPLLNTADALYVGANLVTAAFRGAVEVWSGSGPPPSGLEWAGAFRADIAGNVATSNFVAPSDRRAYIWSDVLSTKCYAEISVTLDPPNAFLASAGMWDEITPTDPGEFGGEIGQLSGEETSGALNDGSSTIFTLTNGADYKAPGAVNSSLFPIVRYGIAYDPSVGRLWIRQVYSGGDGGWIGGGDPTTGTGSTNTDAFTGGNGRLAAAIPPGGVATIYAPADHLGTAPSGFSPV